LARVAAGADVPGDQCLGGTLLSAQADSVTTKFNQKIITMPIAPGAEIWRRGVDLKSPQQLVPGEDIYLRCTRSAGGRVMASLIVAAEKDDSVDMVPHHVVEIRACVGTLIAVAKETVSLKNDNGICVLHIDRDTTFWRGQTFHDASALKLGDEIGARARVDYPSGKLIAEDVEANVDRWEGVITKVLKDTVFMKFDAPVHETVKVIFDRKTQFRNCVFDNDLKHLCTVGDLKAGRHLETIGLVLGKTELRATNVLTISKN
jgi:hypothetical protein